MLRIRLAVIAAMAAGLLTALGADPAKTGDSQRIVSHIPREPVHSTAIAKVGYDVPASVYRDLMSAQSKARYYDVNIKGTYQSLRVRPRQKEQADN